MTAQDPVVAGAQEGSGLKTAIDTVVSPGEAFDRLRVAPTWGWAFLIVFVLLAIGVLLQQPANTHASIGYTEHMMNTSPLFANMTPAQKQKAIDDAKHPSAIKMVFAVFFVPIVILFTALFATVVMLIFNGIGRGTATFMSLWASAINISIISLGLGGLVLGIICLLRGPDSFTQITDLATAAPGLGYFARGGSPFTSTFLAGFSIFTIWGAYLISLAMQRVARVSAGLGYTTGATTLIIGALFPACFALFFAR